MFERKSDHDQDGLHHKVLDDIDCHDQDGLCHHDNLDVEGYPMEPLQPSGSRVRNNQTLKVDIVPLLIQIYRVFFFSLVPPLKVQSTKTLI